MARLPQLADRLERLDEVRERDEPPPHRPSRCELQAPAREFDRVPLRPVLPDAPHDARPDEHQEPDPHRRDHQDVRPIGLGQGDRTAGLHPPEEADPIEQGERLGHEKDDLYAEQHDEGVRDPSRRPNGHGTSR